LFFVMLCPKTGRTERKGSMMKNRFKMKYCTGILVCCILAVSILSVSILVSCGVQDSVILLPEDKNEEEGTKEPVAEGVEPEQKPEEAVPLIFVYVCGAVVSPQVVELPEGSRAKDALEAAGGFSGDAHKEYVNLAEKVTDGQKLYFPTMEEAEALEKEAQNKRLGLVNINTAGLKELMTLPGIGEARAGDIIAYREEHGAFEQKEDLQKVPGIKESMYGKLSDRIIVR